MGSSTGLDWSNACHIVVIRDGKILVESEEGRGQYFLFHEPSGRRIWPALMSFQRLFLWAILISTLCTSKVSSFEGFKRV
jgi:hypothetical protein